MQEPSGAADDSNEDEENDVTVEDVDTPTGRLSMNSYAVKPKCLVLKGGKSTIIFHGLSQLVYISVLSAEAGASGAGARGGADAAPPAFVGDGAGEGGAGAAAATGDDWEIVGNTEQPA